MKKLNWKLIAIILAIASVYAIIRITSILQFYSARSGAMEPTLPPGQRFAVSILKKPSRNDVIAFKRIAGDRDVEKPGTPLKIIYRLLAFGGETVQIKHGLAYVNDQLVDDSTHLKFPYIMPVNRINKILEILKADELDFERIQVGQSEAIALLSYDEYRQVSAITTATKQEPGYFPGDNLYQNDSTLKWTIDNYGPIKIPANHYFLLGDNRHAAMDSRYIGPVPMKDFKGTLLFKY